MAHARLYRVRGHRLRFADAAALAGISPRYFGAFVRDPDGNNEAVFHGAGGGP
ncbi:hypothetical protein I552_7254 [Mycobacterium xenopi 3993]|nr:hypothetical protein I552_7254 [Mycobacterium xenopi 3993]